MALPPARGLARWPEGSDGNGWVLVGRRPESERCLKAVRYSGNRWHRSAGAAAELIERKRDQRDDDDRHAEPHPLIDDFSACSHDWNPSDDERGGPLQPANTVKR